jgi:integrase
MMIAKKEKKPHQPGLTITVAVSRYRISPKWKSLSLKTRQQYEIYLRHFWQKTDQSHYLNDIERGDIVGLMTSFSSNARTNLFKASVSAFYTWCIDQGFTDYNPCVGIKKLPLNQWKPWPEEQVMALIEKGSWITSRAVALAYYTGQRRGDIARLRWSAFDGEGVQFHQQKTGKDLWIPCTPELRKLLVIHWESSPTFRVWNGATFVVDKDTPMFDPYGDGGAIYRMVRKDQIALGFKPLPFHGLRKSCAIHLAENGATEREIMSVTGHTSPDMVSLYVNEARQKVLATNAISKLAS